MLDGSVTDVVEGHSLAFRQGHIDIYSSSWGPDDDGRTLDGPGPLAQKAFKLGVETVREKEELEREKGRMERDRERWTTGGVCTGRRNECSLVFVFVVALTHSPLFSLTMCLRLCVQGRGGRGSIFVWAGGNGGRAADSCSCDGYVVSPYTVAVGAVAEDGSKPWYAEECPALLAVTPSSGSQGQRQIVSVCVRMCTCVCVCVCVRVFAFVIGLSVCGPSRAPVTSATPALVLTRVPVLQLLWQQASLPWLCRQSE